jgi:phosphatidylglycerophosphate synthase
MPSPEVRAGGAADGPKAGRPEPPLGERLADPLNRAVRYPIARALARVVVPRTRVQADHVTLAHLACGLAAAALVARGVTGLLPWALLELRMVLDCLDGVVARARSTSSPRGRAKDEMADATGFLGLVTAIALRTHAWWLGLGLVALGAVAAAGYAVLKRRLLDQPLEQTADPLLAVTRFGDRAASRIFWPSPRRADRAYVVAVSLLSPDNALPLLHLGVLTGALMLGEAAAVGYFALAAASVLALGRRARVR